MHIRVRVHSVMSSLHLSGSGVGVRLKVGINIEKSEGMGSGEGLCPPQLGPGGLPQKKNQFCAKKLCNFEQVLVLLSYITA